MKEVSGILKGKGSRECWSVLKRFHGRGGDPGWNSIGGITGHCWTRGDMHTEDSSPRRVAGPEQTLAGACRVVRNLGLFLKGL